MNIRIYSALLNSVIKKKNKNIKMSGERDSFISLTMRAVVPPNAF